MNIRISYVFILLCILGPVFLYQKSRINYFKKYTEVLVSNKEKLEYCIDIQKNTIKTIQKNYENIIKLNSDLSKKNLKINTEFNKMRNKLDSFTNRLKNVSIKKPKLVEFYANRSFLNVLQQFSKETGYKENTD